MNLAKFFSSSSSPKEIADYLIDVMENKINPINKHTFQNELIHCLTNHKKYPVILFEDKKEKNGLLGYRSLPFDEKLDTYFNFYYFNDDP